MFMQIVVPVDLSDRHQPALDLAARLVERNRGEVTLIHIIEVIPELAVDEEPDFYDNLERRARAHLTRLGEHLAQQHVPCQLVVAYGRPVVEIMRYALETGPDLLVLTTHRLDFHNGQVCGSVSYQVGLFCVCPVLLLK
jgi:nucleotide-binding universal stress UspA family protein